MSVRFPGPQVKLPAEPRQRRRKGRHSEPRRFESSPYPAAPYGATAVCRELGRAVDRVTVSLRAPRRAPVVSWVGPRTRGAHE